MNKTHGIGAAALAMSLSLSASAEERRWYVALEGGAEFGATYNTGSEVGTAVLATIGHRISPSFSVEAEVGQRATEDWYFKIDQTSAFLNALYEAPLTERISLSIGAGVGLDDIQIRSLGGFLGFIQEDSDLQVAAQLKLGLAMEIDESIDLTANYRVVKGFDNDWSGIDNNTLTVGLRFGF